MSYFESLTEINLIREINLYLDLPSIVVFKRAYSEKSDSWISEVFWRHYWYTHFDPKEHVKSLPYHTMPLMTYLHDEAEEPLNPNLMIVDEDETPNRAEIVKNIFSTHFDSWKNLVDHAHNMQATLDNESPHSSTFWDASNI